MPGRVGTAGLVVLVILMVAAFGSLDGLASWLRALIFGAGSAASAYLGVLLQDVDSKTSIEGAARGALSNLVALAGGIKQLMALGSTFRERAAANPPSTIGDAGRLNDVLLDGIEAQARGLLGQTSAAAAAWLPFVTDADEYLSKLAEGSEGE